MNHPRHSFCFAELETYEFDLCTQQYRDLFGWDAVDVAPGYALFQSGGNVVRRVAQQRAVVAGKSGLSHNGDVGGEGAGGSDGRFQFLQIGHRFQNNQINAAFNQCANLFVECRLGFGRRHAPQRRQAHAQRPHRTSQQHR